MPLLHTEPSGENRCGRGSAFVGMSTFGASAPYEDGYKHFGITAERVAEAARSLV